MATDEALLEAMPRLGSPVLRFYGWRQPAASFGYFQHIADVEALTPLRPLVRRPTGGGIVPHNADWTYCLAFPTTDPWYAFTARESYRAVHEWLQGAFARLGIETVVAPQPLKSAAGQCFVGYEESDLLWHGRKIAGAAQRRRNDGLLIQGSVQPPPQSPPRKEWQQAMLQFGAERFGAAWAGLAPDAGLSARIETLAAEKYAVAAYNQKR
jgi:lipoate-protein ligase A